MRFGQFDEGTGEDPLGDTSAGKGRAQDTANPSWQDSPNQKHTDARDVPPHQGDTPIRRQDQTRGDDPESGHTAG